MEFCFFETQIWRACLELCLASVFNMYEDEKENHIQYYKTFFEWQDGEFRNNAFGYCTIF